MILYHGSTVPGLTTLIPHQADHDRPYVYYSTLEVVSGIYLSNAVERPWYWFPYGFDREGQVVYHELYPHALREVYQGKSGYIYSVELPEDEVLPFKNIPCARLGTASAPVKDVLHVPDVYEWLLEQERSGHLRVSRYEEKSPQALKNWHTGILEEIRRMHLIEIPDSSYARFIREKFPAVWEEYIQSIR